MAATKHRILYAEDDVDDVFIIQHAFEKHHGDIEIVHANNGFEALEQLQQMYRSDLLPCLIILDMNMPGMDGRQTLIEIKKSQDFKEIPVVMFTTSSSKTDIIFAESWGAKFMTKPLVYSEFDVLAKSFVSLCKFELTKQTDRPFRT